jgi:serine/threonine-protein kinase
LSDGRSVALHEVLGQGSSATVYRATIQSGWGVKRPVAVKILALGPDVDPGKSMRYVARIVSASVCVRHPAVVQSFEVDATEGDDGTQSPFIVTELVEGESLASMVDGWRADGLRVPIDLAMVVSLRAAEALGASLFTETSGGVVTGLVHGDLSPNQILVSSDGEVKVGDFGLGPFRDPLASDQPLAQLAYAAPEVFAGAPPTPRSDVFSLGVILHELLLGPRFPVGTSNEAALRMVRDGHVPMRLLEPNLPRGIRLVIDRATAADPEDRYPHARAMAFDLRREMLQLGLLDAQTCVRHAVVGWCEVDQSEPSRRKSGVVLMPPDDEEAGGPSSGDTLPSMPVALRR